MMNAAVASIIPIKLRGFEHAPYDIHLNVAINRLCNLSHPRGYDTTPNLDVAPTTLEQVKAYANANQRFLIWDGDCDGTLYGCPTVNANLRAWHDKAHYDYNLDFTVAGEAAAVYIQIAQLLQVYGSRDQIDDWATIIITDILSLVLYHRASGNQWPVNKRDGTIENLDRWRPMAVNLVDDLHGDPSDKNALRLATEVWGNPHPA
jgi:hypothetical protein